MCDAYPQQHKKMIAAEISKFIDGDKQGKIVTGLDKVFKVQISRTDSEAHVEKQRAQ